MLDSGASDVYFEDSIEILVKKGGELDLDAVKAALEDKEVEFTTVSLAPAQA